MAKRRKRRWGTAWEENGRWRIAWPMDGRRPRGPKSARNYSTADKWLGRIERLVEDGKTEEEIRHAIWGIPMSSRLTLRQLAEKYKQRPLRKRRGVPLTDKDKKRRTNDSGHVDRLIARSGFADKQVDLLKAPMLVQWQDDLVGRWSEITSNRYHTKASAICRWGILRGHCATNPFRLIPKFPEDDRPVETWLVPAEVQDVYGHCTEVIHRGIYVCAVSTGMRKGEILDVWWGNIHWDEMEHGVIDLPPRITKTKRHRRIPLTEDLRVELLRLRMAQGNPGDKTRVFPRSGETAYEQFKKALNRSEVVPEDKKPKVTFHVLRHTAASLMMQAGASLPEVAEVLGHSTLEVTRRYAHFAPDYAKEPIKRLGEALNLGIAGRA